MKSISYRVLIPAAGILAILPLGARPHLIEKVEMLWAGVLTRPIDLFDLVLHGGLLGLLALKALMDLRVRVLNTRASPPPPEDRGPSERP
jgi:hypothetical protein